MKRFFKKAAIVLLIVVVVGGLGFVLGKSFAGNGSESQISSGENSIYTDASDLRKDLNIKLAEHVGLTSEALRASYDENASSTAVIDELDNNSKELADIVGDFYGDQAKSTFLKMWQDHITYFVNYTVSAKNDDKEGKEQALSDLEDYSQETAEFFSGLNSNLSVDSTKPLFTEHRDLVIASINDYIGEKYPEAFDKESQAYSQAGEIGDTLSDGIIKQFPDRFSE